MTAAGPEPAAAVDADPYAEQRSGTDDEPPGPARHVHVVGTGLIGTSLGLALRRTGRTVTLQDPSPTAAGLAADLGAGRSRTAEDPEPDMVVVAAPPDVTAQVVAEELARWPSAVVSDLASVKSAVLRELTQLCGRGQIEPGDLERYVGSHPMAGRERSGPIAAQADLFAGRSWVICPGPATRTAAVQLVHAVAAAVGAAPIQMTSAEHDAAVAAVSHVPQLAASLVASRLRDLPDAAVALSGQGVRDVTRIAASDPLMWTQVLAGNAAAVVPVLAELAHELGGVADALRALADPTCTIAHSREAIARAIAHGNDGQARIPGKHGAAPARYALVTVFVPDRPGELGRLLQDMGHAGVNLEDLHLEHGVGAMFGLAELSVLLSAEHALREALTERGWRLQE